MELRQLQYFTAVSRLGGFRRAAESLQVSQPALSQQIKLLEQELGVMLFERGKRQVRLTDAGRVLLARAEQALSDVRLARAELQEFATLRRGRLAVGLLAGSRMVLAPRLLAAFKQQYPDVQVSLVERSTADLLALLEDGQLEVAWLMWSPCDAPPPGVHLGRFFTGELAFAVPPRHRLAHAEVVALGELADEPLILPAMGEPVREIVERGFGSLGRTPIVAVDVMDPAMRVELAAQGLGLAIASEAFIRHVPRERVGLLKISDVAVDYWWVVACATRGMSGRALARFLEFTDLQLRTWVREGEVGSRNGWEVLVDEAVEAVAGRGIGPTRLTERSTDPIAR